MNTGLSLFKSLLKAALWRNDFDTFSTLDSRSLIKPLSICYNTASDFREVNASGTVLGLASLSMASAALVAITFVKNKLLATRKALTETANYKERKAMVRANIETLVASTLEVTAAAGTSLLVTGMLP